MQQIEFVDIKRQTHSIKGEIDQAIANVFNTGDFILGQDVTLFESEFATFCNVRHAVGVDSGYSALVLGMRALGIGHGDEVITPTNSFFASSACICATGAKPVLIDVDPMTYNLDTRLIEACMSKKIKAIMPVHLYGQAANMDAVLAIAKKHNLLVIEDACQAHGAKYKGQLVGSFGHIGAFSLYPAKNLGAYGDGGALVCQAPEVSEKVRQLANYGQSQKNEHVALGGNHRLDTLQAAILRIKLRYLRNWNDQRRAHAELYNQLLGETEFGTPMVDSAYEHVYHLYVIQARQRDKLQAFLARHGIATGIHYPVPIHLQPVFKDLGYSRGQFPVAERVAKRILSLPMFPGLKATEIEQVAHVLLKYRSTKTR